MKARLLIVAAVCGVAGSLALGQQPGLDHPAPAEPSPVPASAQPDKKPSPPREQQDQEQSPPEDLSTVLERPGEIVLVATGFRATEGPLWLAERRSLIFCDMGKDGLYEIRLVGKPVEFADAGHFRVPSGNTWGTALEPGGTIVCALHDRRIERIDAGGSNPVVVVSAFEGKKLNAPNDVAVHRDGAIYFTDPPFGIRPESRELDFSGVYRVLPDGSSMTLLTRQFKYPNGIAFSPDYATLYVTEYGDAQVFAFPVRADGSLGEGRLFADLRISGIGGGADGLKTDTQGNVYATGPTGVHVVDRRGNRVGRIKTPGNPSNVAFGGEDGRTLFITAGKNVLYVRTKFPGANLPWLGGEQAGKRTGQQGGAGAGEQGAGEEVKR
jgi:gluconolactonase